MADEKEKDQEKELTTTGIVRVLEILANKVSRKAAIVGMAMVLIYLLAVTPTVVTDVLVIIGFITGLAIFVTVLQWTIDKKVAKYRQELKLEKKEKEN